MNQIIAEGNNIGEWDKKEITNINCLYAQAEIYLNKGNKMYDINLWLEAFVYYMRLTKVYELICKNSHLVISNRRHLNIKRNVYRVLPILEFIKPKLLMKYEKLERKLEHVIEKNEIKEEAILPSVPVSKDTEYSDLLKKLDERWKNIQKPLSNQSNRTHQIVQTQTKTTDNINNCIKLKYVDKNGKPLDALTILQMHLKLYNRDIVDVPGDNNCQFHAIADQLKRIGILGWTDRQLRQKAVEWLNNNEIKEMDDNKIGERTLLRDAVGIVNWKHYITEISKHNVTWGDEATLLALSVLFKLEIIVISSLPENYVHTVRPPKFWNIELNSKIYLGHYHEFHYVSTKLI